MIDHPKCYPVAIITEDQGLKNIPGLIILVYILQRECHLPPYAPRVSGQMSWQTLSHKKYHSKAAKIHLGG